MCAYAIGGHRWAAQSAAFDVARGGGGGGGSSLAGLGENFFVVGVPLVWSNWPLWERGTRAPQRSGGGGLKT